MKSQIIHRSKWAMPTALLIIFAIVGCTGQVNAPTLPPARSSAPAPSSTPAVGLPSPETDESMSMPTSQPPEGENPLYQDDFTDPSTGWPDKKTFDNYFIGYHEPEWYHIQITGSNYKAPVIIEPNKKSYEDATLELPVFTVAAKTDPTGDFRYGLVFRRSGDRYYAFTISPNTKKWEVLKFSPNGVETLQEGVDDSIHDRDVDDLLRVDAMGSNFFFYINDNNVGQVSDSDYAKGEVGLYAESFDSPTIHIHYDALTIRTAPSEEPDLSVQDQDDFTDPSTGWPVDMFDNYFVGYHEPQWYFIQITSANYKAPVIIEPKRKSYQDATLELQVFTDSANTAPTGDFRYGLVFRRSGDQYYAFTISARTKKWEVLKSSPSGLETLKEGIEESIQGLNDMNDLLRVDALGSNYLLHINDRLVGQVSDSDYAEGEIGLYAESFDSTQTRIHFDALTIRDLKLDLICNINGGTVNVRSGPGKTYSQIALLANGATVEALGISSNRWIEIKVEGSEAPGWVSYSEGYMSCTPPIDVFPVISP